jgi:Uma2 family endonuclease
MSAIATQVTVEEFLALPEEEVWGKELIDGEIVEMGFQSLVHEIVKARTLKILVRGIGDDFLVVSEALFSVEGGSRRHGLKPDLAVIHEPLAKLGWYPVVAVEVVSSEPARRLNQKINLYFEMGAKAAWALYPDDHSIVVHSPDGSAKRLGRNEWVEAPGIFPGLRIQVEDFFRGIE